MHDNVIAHFSPPTFLQSKMKNINIEIREVIDVLQQSTEYIYNNKIHEKLTAQIAN